MADNDFPAGAGFRTKRRRSSSRRSASVTSQSMERMIVVAGILIGLAFVVLSYKDFRYGYFAFGKHKIGESKNETIYGFNAPQFVRSTPDAAWTPPANGRAGLFAADYWRYAASGSGQTDISYGDGGGATRITCGMPDPVAAACPSLFGIRIGDTEDDAVYTLGMPSREIYQAAAKTIVYPELGMALKLEQFRVTEIIMTEASGASWPLRYLRWTLP